MLSAFQTCHNGYKNKYDVSAASMVGLLHNTCILKVLLSWCLPFSCVSLPFSISGLHSSLPFTIAFVPSNFAIVSALLLHRPSELLFYHISLLSQHLNAHSEFEPCLLLLLFYMLCSVYELRLLPCPPTAALCPVQDAVDRGWLLDEASHFSGVLGLNRLLLTGLELAKALAYLHRLDILHGDLTGGNVMLTSAPVTKHDPRGFTVKVKLLLKPGCKYSPTEFTESSSRVSRTEGSSGKISAICMPDGQCTALLVFVMELRYGFL